MKYQIYMINQNGKELVASSASRAEMRSMLNLYLSAVDELASLSAAELRDSARYTPTARWRGFAKAKSRFVVLSSSGSLVLSYNVDRDVTK